MSQESRVYSPKICQARTKQTLAEDTLEFVGRELKSLTELAGTASFSETPPENTTQTLFFMVSSDTMRFMEGQRRKRRFGHVGLTCVCGEPLPPDRKLRVCRDCHRKASQKSYATNGTKIRTARQVRYRTLGSLTGYQIANAAYERRGIQQKWLTRQPCPCGHTTDVRLKLTREDPAGDRNATPSIVAREWLCSRCRGEELSLENLRRLPVGDADEFVSAIPLKMAPAFDQDTHEMHRQHIVSWIEELAADDRQRLVTLIEAMRGVVPSMLWNQRSMLWKDAAIKAYAKTIGALPI